MFSQLLKTEFEANRVILLVSLVLNIFFLLVMDRSEEDPLQSFIGATMITYFVLLVVASAREGDSKRYRLYAQLPLTSNQQFFAGWFWVLTWLGLQVGMWLLYALIIDSELSIIEVIEIASIGLGIWFFMVTIANAIDLGSFKPAYLQWGYIGLFVILIGVAIQNEISVSISLASEEACVFPLKIFGSTLPDIAFAITLVALLMIGNWYIFTRSENYLR